MEHVMVILDGDYKDEKVSLPVDTLGQPFLARRDDIIVITLGKFRVESVRWDYMAMTVYVYVYA